MRGAGEAEEAVPGLVDGRGEGIEVEHRHGPEIGQGFHQGQGDAGQDGRSRHGQGNVPERSQGRLAQHPCGLHQALALGQEGRACEQIDIGVEHQHQHGDHPTGGAHTGQAHGPEPFTQQGLYGAGEVQQADEDKRQYVGGNGEGQHQCPIQPAPAGELAKAGQPGQAHAKHGYADPDAEYQGQRIAQQAGHLRIQQVYPYLLIHALP
ncbi:hypothetical protein D3C80_1034190 [compost metagenome]